MTHCGSSPWPILLFCKTSQMKNNFYSEKPCRHLVTSEVALLLTRCLSQIPGPHLCVLGAREEVSPCRKSASCSHSWVCGCTLLLGNFCVLQTDSNSCGTLCCAQTSLHAWCKDLSPSEQWAQLGYKGKMSVPLFYKCSFLPVYPIFSSWDRSTFWYQVVFWSDPDFCCMLSSGN